MQLHVARLCLDCNEVHDLEHCPVCTSEAFAFLTRWIPAQERRQVPRPASSPAGEVYRDLLAQSQPGTGRAPRKGLNKGILGGVGLLAVAGYLLQRRGKGNADTPNNPADAAGDVEPERPKDSGE